MPYAQGRRDSTRRIVRLLFGTTLAAALVGCTNTPTAKGVPWWPQGPGSTSEDVEAAASSMRPVDSGHSPSTQPATGYAEAVRYGDLYFVSGQIADDPESHAIVGSSVEAQIHAAMSNVMRILERHGLTSSNILSISLYLQDVDDLPKADATLTSYFKRSLPARSVVPVNGLPRGSLVEISVIAGK